MSFLNRLTNGGQLFVNPASTLSKFLSTALIVFARFVLVPVAVAYVRSLLVLHPKSNRPLDIVLSTSPLQSPIQPIPLAHVARSFVVFDVYGSDHSGESKSEAGHTLLKLPAHLDRGMFIFIPSSNPNTSPSLYFLNTGAGSAQGVASILKLLPLTLSHTILRSISPSLTSL